MPDLSLEATRIELSRNIALLDSNVLVSYIDERDTNHAMTREYLDELSDYELVVVMPILVEASGLFARRNQRHLMLNLFHWIITPGHVLLMPSMHRAEDLSRDVARHVGVLEKYGIDYVDSYLIDIAHLISVTCEIRPYVPILTYDTGDFTRCSGSKFQFSVFDMRAWELYPSG